MALFMRRRFLAALLGDLTTRLPAPVAGVAPAMSRAEGLVPLEPGRITAAQPAGLFYRVEVARAGPQRIETKTWLFLPGQRVSRVYPYGGAFDPSRCGPDTCGSYQIDASQLAVRFDGGRVLQWPSPRTPTASAWMEPRTGPRA
jgi:hypothetical protein